MSANIPQCLKYYIETVYSGRKNTYNCSGTGSLSAQYDTLYWTPSNPDPKPDLSALEAVQSDADLYFRRLSCISNMKEYAYYKKSIQQIVFGGYDYEGNDKSQTNLLRSISNGIDTRNWYDINNIAHSTTKVDRQAMFALCDEINQLFKDKQEYYRTQIMASSDPESIDITQGYPPNPYSGT